MCFTWQTTFQFETIPPHTLPSYVCTYVHYTNFTQIHTPLSFEINIFYKEVNRFLISINYYYHHHHKLGIRQYSENGKNKLMYMRMRSYSMCVMCVCVLFVYGVVLIKWNAENETFKIIEIIFSFPQMHWWWWCCCCRIVKCVFHYLFL